MPEKTEAYITVVGSDHKIDLPAKMSVGAKVAIILVDDDQTVELARQQRFADTLAAIRAASLEKLPVISDTELDKLVDCKFLTNPPAHDTMPAL